MRRMTSLFLALGVVILMSGAALAGVTPGAEAPGFTLKDTDGNEHTLQSYLDEGKIVVQTFAAVSEKNVVWLAINSGAPGKEGAGLERNQKAVKEYEMPFPVLIDESGEVGKAYGAKTSPHMFIIASDGTVAYNGAIDDDRSASKLGKTNYVAAALNALLEGNEVEISETRAYGCSVKYGH